MRSLSVILILGITISCNNPTLKVKDLDFADIEEAARKRSNVDTTYIISLNAFADINKFDTVGRVIFNNDGKPIIDASNPFSVYMYEYDTSGLIAKIRHRDFDIYLQYSSTSSFIVDSLVLRQNWKGDAEFISEYRFSSIGQLQEQVDKLREEDWLDYGMQHIIGGLNQSGMDNRRLDPNLSRFYYDDSGLLIKREDWVKDTISTWLKSTTKFYYGTEDNIIDSTITEFPDFNYKTRTFYDDDGLKRSRVYNDTLTVIFAHRKVN
jgi:hypothetical protein